VEVLEYRRAKDHPWGQRSADVYRRANEGDRHEAERGNLEQSASDHRSAAQAWPPDRNAVPTAAREQRLGAGELFWPDTYVATEAFDQRASAATYYGIQSAGSDP
jgi:hypothetical protein